MAILTLGHSTHEPERFVEVLDVAKIDVVIDVRSHRSSKWEWWRGENMGWIREAGRELQWRPGLGGWDERHIHLAEWAAPRGVDLTAYAKGHFPKERIGAKIPNREEGRRAEPDMNPDWAHSFTSRGLADYAWFTATDEWQKAATDLWADYGDEDQPRAAIICAEMLWWKCHRSMIADFLWCQNCLVEHITPRFTKTLGVRATYTPHDGDDRIERYPHEVLEIWELGEGVK